MASDPESKAFPPTLSEAGPRRIGDYEVVGGLGQGNMGEVLVVRDVRTGARRALKRLHDASSDGRRNRFLREIDALKRLSHPNVVKVFDEGTAPSGEPYLVMELIDGRNLADLVKDRTLELTEVHGVVRQLANALAAVHDAGIVHRDVKPQNIVVDPKTLRVTLVDFGVALDDSRTRLTAPGRMVGTPAFLAPEILAGESPTAASDVFALGVVLYWLRNGRHPFPSRTVPELIAHYRKMSPPPLAPGLGLEALGPMLIQRSPAARPSMRFVADFLDAADSRGEAPALDPSTVVPRSLLGIDASTTGDGPSADVTPPYPSGSPATEPGTELATLPRSTRTDPETLPGVPVPRALSAARSLPRLPSSPGAAAISALAAPPPPARGLGFGLGIGLGVGVPIAVALVLVLRPPAPAPVPPPRPEPPKVILPSDKPPVAPTPRRDADKNVEPPRPLPAPTPRPAGPRPTPSPPAARPAPSPPAPPAQDELAAARRRLGELLAARGWTTEALARLPESSAADPKAVGRLIRLVSAIPIGADGIERRADELKALARARTDLDGKQVRQLDGWYFTAQGRRAETAARIEALARLEAVLGVGR